MTIINKTIKQAATFGQISLAVLVALLLSGCNAELASLQSLSEGPSDGLVENPFLYGGTDDLSEPFGGILTIDPALLPDSGYPRCSAEDMRWMAVQVARDRYYFKDQLPSIVNIEDYSSTNEMLKAIRYEQKDHFSYSITGKQYEDNNVKGEYKGFGTVWRFNEAANAYVFTMIHDGPARAAGIRRGDQVVTVNGRSSKAIQQLYADNNSAQIWTHPDGLETSEFVWRNAQGEIKSASLLPKTVKLVTTHDYSILENTPTKTGFLSYQRFRRYDEKKLDQALAFFDKENVQELVVDLRYNPGGYVSLAQKLASSMLSSADEDEILIRTDYVDGPFQFESRYMNDRTWAVKKVDHNLNLSRVYVLTTESSCSASELFIHALKPYIDVVQIGEATCGKPFGSLPIPYCKGQNETDGELWSIINFESQNADFNGEYYDGITPTCAVSEGDIYPWGDTRDTLVSAAVHHMENGTCPAQLMTKRSLNSTAQPVKSKVDFRAENMLFDHN